MPALAGEPPFTARSGLSPAIERERQRELLDACRAGGVSIEEAFKGWGMSLGLDPVNLKRVDIGTKEGSTLGRLVVTVTGSIAPDGSLQGPARTFQRTLNIRGSLVHLLQDGQSPSGTVSLKVFNDSLSILDSTRDFILWVKAHYPDVRSDRGARIHRLVKPVTEVSGKLQAQLQSHPPTLKGLEALAALDGVLYRLLEPTTPRQSPANTNAQDLLALAANNIRTWGDLTDGLAEADYLPLARQLDEVARRLQGLAEIGQSFQQPEIKPGLGSVDSLREPRSPLFTLPLDQARPVWALDDKGQGAAQEAQYAAFAAFLGAKQGGFNEAFVAAIPGTLGGVVQRLFAYDNPAAVAADEALAREAKKKGWNPKGETLRPVDFTLPGQLDIFLQPISGVFAAAQGARGVPLSAASDDIYLGMSAQAAAAVFTTAQNSPNATQDPATALGILRTALRESGQPGDQAFLNQWAPMSTTAPQPPAGSQSGGRQAAPTYTPR